MPAIDKRTKEYKAQQAALKAAPVAATLEDPYTKDWTTGFEAIKAGEALPADANTAMLEGGRAAQQQANVIAQAQAALRQPARTNYAGYEVERGAAVEEHSAPSDTWESPTRESARQAPAPAPQPAIPSVFVVAPPITHNSSYHERRARDIIRAAQERAVKETTVAQEFLQYPQSATKREAFVALCSSVEIPGPPPATAYGDRDESYMHWLADWKPEEFKTKFARVAAPLARRLLEEIAAR